MFQLGSDCISISFFEYQMYKTDRHGQITQGRQEPALHVNNTLVAIYLKVSKCEIFDPFDCNDFYVMKSIGRRLWGWWGRNIFYLNMGQICIILSLRVRWLRFLTWVSNKTKLFQIPLRSTWMCQNSFFWVFICSLGKTWLRIQEIKISSLKWLWPPSCTFMRVRMKMHSELEFLKSLWGLGTE